MAWTSADAAQWDAVCGMLPVSIESLADAATGYPSRRNEQPSITCPQCGMTTYNPHDIVEGYCGNCCAWTRTKRR